jgi:hypothetical protein
MALDSLVDDGHVTPGQRFVVKLDVEGVPSLDSMDEARRMSLARNRAAASLLGQTRAGVGTIVPTLSAERPIDAGAAEVRGRVIETRRRRDRFPAWQGLKKHSGRLRAALAGSLHIRAE